MASLMHMCAFVNWLFIDSRNGSSPFQCQTITLANVDLLSDENIYHHYVDVIMGAIASQITSLTIVYSNVYSDADQRKHQSSASLAFVWGIHQGLVNSLQKWPVTRKMFPFDDVIMIFRPHDVNIWHFSNKQTSCIVVNQSQLWVHLMWHRQLLSIIFHSLSGDKHSMGEFHIRSNISRRFAPDRTCQNMENPTEEIHEDIGTWKGFHITGPLCGESTSNWWIPHAKG